MGSATFETNWARHPAQTVCDAVSDYFLWGWKSHARSPPTCGCSPPFLSQHRVSSRCSNFARPLSSTLAEHSLDTVLIRMGSNALWTSHMWFMRWSGNWGICRFFLIPPLRVPSHFSSRKSRFAWCCWCSPISIRQWECKLLRWSMPWLETFCPSECWVLWYFWFYHPCTSQLRILNPAAAGLRFRRVVFWGCPSSISCFLWVRFMIRIYQCLPVPASPYRNPWKWDRVLIRLGRVDFTAWIRRSQRGWGSPCETCRIVGRLSWFRSRGFVRCFVWFFRWGFPFCCTSPNTKWGVVWWIACNKYYLRECYKFIIYTIGFVLSYSLLNVIVANFNCRPHIASCQLL